jgi:hypothetical protein
MSKNANVIPIHQSFSKNFVLRNGSFYKKLKKGKTTPLTNFYAVIISRKIKKDKDEIIDQLLELEVNFNNKSTSFDIFLIDFQSSRLMKKINEKVGLGAILYGSTKDLHIAIQELSGQNIPENTITTSIGFTTENTYLSTDMLITPEKIIQNPDIEIDLSESNFAKNINFIYPDNKKVKKICEHVLKEFLELKDHSVTYPLIGHIFLAPFTSLITDITGKRKPALHLIGSSGGGKTFFSLLAMSFFGNFEDRMLSWNSTANAIESEGWYFRDSLFLVDDFKSSIVDPKVVIRIFQGYSEGHGRARLSTTSKLKNPPHVRGLLLSTGEDFVHDVESITGRTILIYVNPEKDTKIGKLCWEKRNLYSMILPKFIQTIIKTENWTDHYIDLVQKNTGEFVEIIPDVANGLRIASNWALNSMGFQLFTYFLKEINIITKEKQIDMQNEYMKIAREHLTEHVEKIKSENPVEILFRLLSQKFQIQAVRLLDHLPQIPKQPIQPNITLLSNIPGSTKGKIIGILKVQKQKVYIFPDSAIELLSSYFRITGQKMPLSRNSLSKSLIERKLIPPSQNNRITKQVRGLGGKRFQAWEFDATLFNDLCELI